jgi:hypothetical protein
MRRSRTGIERTERGPAMPDAAPQRLIVVAPSVLSADFGRLAEEVRTVDAAQAHRIHVVAMDVRLVPEHHDRAGGCRGGAIPTEATWAFQAMSLIGFGRLSLRSGPGCPCSMPEAIRRARLIACIRSLCSEDMLDARTDFRFGVVANSELSGSLAFMIAWEIATQSEGCALR